ncbi:DUF7338 family protein [Burkholderia anthina]|uniref:DUF7338 family protein n=1 Tax=Burkholderia anthina TaxID=179879 RepID=UPI0015882BFD|nr:hypothetical protein [Burkholderia anthina]
MYAILYLFMALASLLGVAATWLLAPLLAFTADADGNLPRALHWFQTFDNTLDAGWKVQGSYGTYLQNGAIPTGPTLWWYRTCWLWRNPGYGFDYWPLGLEFYAAEWTVRVDSAKWWIATGPNGAFCVKYLGTTGVGLKLGWKAWAYWQSGAWAPNSYLWGPDRRLPICFTL